MQEYITDNLISIIGILTTIIIAVITFIKNKKRKELSFDVLSSTSLLIKDEELKNRIKLTIDDAEVKEDIHLVLVKLINTGNVPIKPDEFIEELTIECNGSIIVAEVKETVPPNLTVKVDNGVGDIFGIASVEPLLLNPKDEIIFKFLVSLYKNDISFNGRIVGVQKINKRKSRLPLTSTILGIGTIIVMLLLGNYEKDFEMIKFYTLSASLLTGMLASATVLAIHEMRKGKKELNQ
ncbi:hypothetical protein V7122_07465 [Bacillus sp. JJ1532]|uniref:hypothetical protein n=1 Tax=Bacillus sp. JJ1532 TaxID=3122958 RepID=UPI002FFDE034